jgi:hypothetical protein
MKKKLENEFRKIDELIKNGFNKIGDILYDLKNKNEDGK